MPSSPFNQLVDVEETMCKQLLSLDLREQTRALSSLGLVTTSPGCMGPSRRQPLLSFSMSPLAQLSAESTDTAFLPASHWGEQQQQQPERAELPSQFSNASWGKSGFWAERSMSMVETGSVAAVTLGWPDAKAHQAPPSPSPPPSSSAAAFLFSASALSSSSSSSSSASSSSRYKTELCRSFAESGVCKYGGKCQFAHGAEELRDLNRHPKYKTEPCRTFHTVGFCPYGIRCHFVHNNEEEGEEVGGGEQRRSCSPFTSCPFAAASSCGPARPRRPPLLRQSFSFAGFPSAPHQPPLLAAVPPHPSPPPPCADITELLSHALLEMDSPFEASRARYPQPPVAAAHPQSLPSPDSGCSLYGFSPAASPSLGSTGPSAGLPGPLGARSLSYASLSDQEPDGSVGDGSSASSLSGSESGGVAESNARRLAVFSQLSVPEDVTRFFL